MLRPRASQPDAPGDPLSARLDEVLGEYLEAAEAGRAPDRDAFLAAHPELAEDLAQFLADQDRFDALVAPITVQRGPTDRTGPAATTTSSVGQSFGNYELLEEIARGGMGVVYKARQFVGSGEPRPFRVVALKMMSEGPWASLADVQRFRHEAAAVARLDHPHIVPLYDVGEHDTGAGLPCPYFSMKLVEGGSLAQHLAHFTGRSRDCARLILTVARAVEYAHQRGILHRDLKPGNILLDGNADTPVTRWTPLVADFGLAKRLAGVDQSTNSPTPVAPATQPGGAVGTPSYMAPEQATGSTQVTTAADVYSLGAILYECLAGRPPFRTSTGLGTLLEALEREAAPPSRHCPGIDRDLDTICLKCLQKEPGRRYATAGALADDLQRYLNGEPIQARPVGRLERLTRWCRRQPLLAALSAAVVLSVTVGVALVVWQWQRAEQQEEAQREQKEEAQRLNALLEKSLAEERRQRNRAEEGFREAHQVVNKFCLQLSEEDLRAYPGLQPVRKKLLESGLKYLQRFIDRNEGDPKLREELASTYFDLGMVTSSIGSKQEAMKAYQRALELYRELLKKDPMKKDPNNAEWKHQIVGALINLGNLQHAVGRDPDTRESLRQARVLIEELDGNDPHTQSKLASIFINQASLEQGKGDLKKALECNHEAQAVLTRLIRAWPKETGYEVKLSTALYNEGNMQGGLGRMDNAVECYQKARTIQERLLEVRRDDSALRASLGHTYTQLGVRYNAKGQGFEALAVMDMAKTTFEKLVEANPKVTEYRHALAIVYNNLSSIHARAGRPAEALNVLKKSADLQQRLTEDHPDVPEFRLGLAQTYHNIGNRARSDSRLDDALRYYDKATGYFDSLLARSPNSPSYNHYAAGTLNNIGDVLQKLKRPEEAVKKFEDALSRERKAFDRAPQVPAHRRSLSSLYHNLARAHRLAKRPAPAVELTLERRKLWSDNPNELYRVACDLVLAADLVPRDAPEKSKYTDLALETLRQALKAGYRDLDKLRNNPDLESLRAHPGFSKLLKEFDKGENR